MNLFRISELRKAGPTPDISKILTSVSGAGAIHSGRNPGSKSNQVEEDLMGQPGGGSAVKAGREEAGKPNVGQTGQPGGRQTGDGKADQADGTSRKTDTITKLVHKTNEFWK